MTRSALLLLGLLSTHLATLAAQTPANLEDLVERRRAYLLPETLEAYTGPVLAHWNAATLRIRGTLRNGRWDGVRESYYLDGKLEVRETYRNGVLHGPFESYFRTGRPSDRGTYEDGELEGEYEAFWSRVQGDIHAAHQGEHGDAIETGDVMERGAWSDGQPCGEWYRFVPRNSQGLRTGETVTYPPCPAPSR